MEGLEIHITEDMIRRVQEARQVSRAQAKWLIESYIQNVEDEPHCCSVPYEPSDSQSKSVDEIVDQICQ